MLITTKSPALLITVTALLSVFTAPAVLAEQIKIPVGQQAEGKAQIKLPAKGMSKAHVQQEFGEPLAVTAARGTPPISSWKYRDFVVYFENGHVIHTVRSFQPQQTEVPAATEPSPTAEPISQ